MELPLTFDRKSHRIEDAEDRSIADMDSMEFSADEDRSHAALIVRAVNAHDDLFAACDAILNRLDYLRNLWGDEGVTRSLCDQVRAAVAKAKEVS